MAWLHVRYHSETLRMPVSMEVLLPQPRSAGNGKLRDPGPYAALYLLHGMMGDDASSWLRRTNLETYVEGLPLAIVMPAGHLGLYTDMAFGREYFTFISKELPALCERMFPLSRSRADRFIAGASAGGYGALKAGLLASETFRASASFSGELDVMRIYGELAPGMATDIFGHRDGVKGSENDLFAAAERLVESGRPRPDLYLSCGTEDRRFGEHARFKEHVRGLGLSLTFEKSSGAADWSNWDLCVLRLLRWLPLRKSAATSGEEAGYGLD